MMQVENFTSSNGCRLSEGLNGVNLKPSNGQKI